ncbi:MAG TPA: alpha/beta hydrolase [Anaerolineaceae bacterium]|nr:alpha/beta hydrolase [Anaerolineaceae bacterium]
MYLLDPNPSGSPCVLLLHGLGMDGSSWFLQTRALVAAGYRPLAVDLPGFGQSPRSNGRWTMRRAVAELVAELTARGLPPIPLVGISLGGALALQIALDYPHIPTRLVLINAFPCLRPLSREMSRYLLRRAFRSAFVGPRAQAEAVAAHLFPRAEQTFLRTEVVSRILQTDQRTYRAAMRAIALLDLRPRLAELRLPVLVITGERDGTIPPRNQTQMARRIPGAVQVVIPDAGHGVVIEQPDRVNQELLAFLRPSV